MYIYISIYIYTYIHIYICIYTYIYRANPLTLNPFCVVQTCLAPSPLRRLLACARPVARVSAIVRCKRRRVSAVSTAGASSDPAGTSPSSSG